MALSADTPVVLEEGGFNHLPVKASTKIYEGALVGLTSGYARGLVAGDTFVGVAARQADNSAVATDGAINVKVRAGRFCEQVTLASVAVTDVGKAVYASDDATFTLTATSNSLVGRVARYVAANTCVVEFNAPVVMAGAHIADVASVTQDALVDNGGGTADGTVDSQAAPVTLTDSTTLDGSHDDTVANAQKTDGTMGGTADGAFEAVGATNGGDVSGAIMNNFKECQAGLATLTQNDSDLAQKIIQLVALAAAAQNNLKEVTTELAKIKTDNDAQVTKINAILARLEAAGINLAS